MKRYKVSSSIIKSIGYLNNTIEIEYMNGSVYKYFDTSVQIYAEIIRATSVGATSKKLLKGKKFVKID